MKKTLLGLALIALSSTASSADFFGGNNGEWKMGPHGPYYDESNWPVWTPMYWMEEMMDSFDNDNSYGSAPAYYPQQMPMMQQPSYNYGYQAPAPQAPVAPAQPTQK